MKHALQALAVIAFLIAGSVPVSAQTVEREPDATAYSKSQAESGGFVISNTTGDTLFVAEPNHQIKMGRLPAAEVFVNRDGSGGLQVTRGAADGSGIWGILTNEESGFYAVRGETAGRGTGVLGLGHAGQRGTGVLGVSNGGGAGVRGYAYGDGGMGGVFYTNTTTFEPALVAEYGGSGTGAAFVARRYGADPDANIAAFGTGAVGSEGEKYVTGITGAGNIWTVGSIHAQGTITSDGADFAERFAVMGETSLYEAGDVLQISGGADRHLELSAEPYSSRIAGVYATKPGVLLGNLPAEESVPLGVVGVVPTKVTIEGGAITRGDLLVTSSLPGHAMKGDTDRIRVGMVIGRALQNFDGEASGMIEVLVNVQ